MRRPRTVSHINYAHVTDEALKEIRQHVGSESRQRDQLDDDKSMWAAKLAKVEAEIRRRGI